MKRTTIMKAFYANLLGIVLVLVLAPLVAAKPSSWDKQIKGAGRFTVLKQFNSEAVLDKETGLVWERSPDPNLTGVSWPLALATCNGKVVGGRLGWRVPTAPELASLIDPNNSTGNLELPSGHPFAGVHGTEYWSANTRLLDTTTALTLNFGTGTLTVGPKNSNRPYWCVRGGQGVDPT